MQFTALTSFSFLFNKKSAGKEHESTVIDGLKNHNAVIRALSHLCIIDLNQKCNDTANASPFCQNINSTISDGLKDQNEMVRDACKAVNESLK
jgi:hypothetical protein